MAALLVGLILAVGCIIILAAPLRRRPTAVRFPLEELDDISAQLQVTYDEIKTLSLEFNTGQVPEEQYSEQLGSLRSRAAALLQKMDLLEQSTVELDKRLEQQISALRDGRGSSVKGDVCSRCGAKLVAGPSLHTCSAQSGSEE